MKPTFKQQYDKIVGAYLRNELEPYINCACFIGNLLNNTGEWQYMRAARLQNTNPMYVRPQFRSYNDPEYQFYTMQEIVDMENMFLSTLHETELLVGFESELPIYKAMESTLLLLRQIHESKGEVVEDYIFEKRALIEQ